MSSASYHLLYGAYKSCMYPLNNPSGTRKPRGGNQDVLFLSIAHPYSDQSSKLGNHPPPGTTQR
jgi:hypothetical protein